MIFYEYFDPRASGNEVSGTFLSTFR